ncbi:MAG: ribonuclease R [Acidobacteriota bacterium]
MPRTRKRVQPDPPVTGRMEAHREGFGFVLPDGNSGRDIFVRSDRRSGSLHGDRVEVRITTVRRDGRREGTVVRILERVVQRVSGVYRAASPGGLVEPFDGRFPADIRIPSRQAGKARDGEVVGCEITRMAGSRRPAEGRVIEVWGFQDDPEMDFRVITWKHGLRKDFPPDVLEECDRCTDLVGQAKGREDFRNLPVITIDPPTARDHDDAVSWQPSGNGGGTLGVHIADVAHFVPEGSATDREALLRGTSVYFPGTCLPMLPEPLSSDLCSLRPDRDRLTLSVLLELDSRGRVVDTRFNRGIIRSRARMTYTEVAEILQGKDEGTIPDGLSREYFLDLERVARLLNTLRRAQGSIDFDLPEPNIILDDRGRVTGIVPLERNSAHKLIEEFMLAANQAVARKLFASRVPSLYRIHERPDPFKLEAFNRILETFGFNLPGPYRNLPPAVFQNLLDSFRGLPEEGLLTRLLLRSMKQARYSDEPGEHFGLAMGLYTHFTSPIRRYPDLVVHRLLHRLMESKPITARERGSLREKLPEISRESSRLERIAEAAERELIEWKKVSFMAERLGEEYEGYISGVARFGFFVTLEELFVDGLVPVGTIREDRYRFLERKQILRGERRGRVFRLGARVRVRVDRVGFWPARIDFSLVENNRDAGVKSVGRVPA